MWAKKDNKPNTAEYTFIPFCDVKLNPFCQSQNSAQPVCPIWISRWFYNSKDFKYIKHDVFTSSVTRKDRFNFDPLVTEKFVITEYLK